MRTFFLLLFCGFFITACTNDGASTDKADSKTDDKTTETKTEGSKKYKLTPFTASKTFPDATIKSMTYKAGKFEFGVEGNYELGQQTDDAPKKMCANSAKGQHIHLIVDNGPYAAKYVSDFEHEIADGAHYLLAFLSRSYHESIKTPTAHVAQKITVANQSIEKTEPISDPMVFYSRPKGTYTGKANTQKVMLDFYLANANLGADYTINASINGEDHSIDNWQPYYIEGLPMGKNTIELTLLDKEGKKVDAPLNPVTREFELKVDELE